MTVDTLLGKLWTWQSGEIWWNQNHTKQVYPPTTHWLPFQKVFTEDSSSGCNLPKNCYGAFVSPETHEWCGPSKSRYNHCWVPKHGLFHFTKLSGFQFFIATHRFSYIVYIICIHLPGKNLTIKSPSCRQHHGYYHPHQKWATHSSYPKPNNWRLSGCNRLVYRARISVDDNQVVKTESLRIKYCKSVSIMIESWFCMIRSWSAVTKPHCFLSNSHCCVSNLHCWSSNCTYRLTWYYLFCEYIRLFSCHTTSTSILWWSNQLLLTIRQGRFMIKHHYVSMIHPQISMTDPVLRVCNGRMFMHKALVELLCFLLFQPHFTRSGGIRLPIKSCSQRLVNSYGLQKEMRIYDCTNRCCQNPNGMHIHACAYTHTHLYFYIYIYNIYI